jgi:uncharacterized protein YigE (DUF2233 family)
MQQHRSSIDMDMEYRRRWRWIAALMSIALLLLTGCSESEGPVLTLPTLMPTATGVVAPLPDPLDPPSTDPLDTGWRSVGQGVGVRQLQVAFDNRTARISMARIDPDLVRLRVGYAPSEPLLLSAWAAQEHAVVVINGGFFDADYRSVALVVRDGVAFGSSYVGHGAMFSVADDGSIRLRSLADQPYEPSEAPQQALQGWPLLVRDGLAAYTFEDGERARRSVLAIDQDGRLLLIACGSVSFTLAELAQWLMTTDLAIDVAVNLDGGSSTGFLVEGADAVERVDAFVPLPIVLLVQAR